ncbi:phosphatidic acid phosphatase type 2/haloperoxidase [Kalaharituber pfeilii]|nr:phosphatidic acid phosphatase type 2/haloperoxidase [Kalaharituber pfeilii]
MNSAAVISGSSPGRGCGAGSAFSRFWRRSYVPDWIGLLLIVIGYIITLTNEPYHRMFSLDDRRIQFPHAEIERVSLTMRNVYAIALPLVVIMLFTVSKATNRNKWHQLHVSILGLLIALAFTGFSTDFIKNAVGRPRPDLIARCKPRDDAPRHELVTYEICTETDHFKIQDGFRSFPSGHSSLAFAGLGYLSLFLSGQLHAFKRGADLCRFLFAILPVFGALVIAISRTGDYRHDVYDVTSGGIIGSTIAYYSYQKYFPALISPNCDEPYLSRLAGEEDWEVLQNVEAEIQNLPPSEYQQ